MKDTGRALFAVLLIAAFGRVNAEAQAPVTWTDMVGVSAAGNNLTRTAPGQGWGDSGAAGLNIIRDGSGYMEFTATEFGTYRMTGLGHGDTNASYEDID